MAVFSRSEIQRENGRKMVLSLGALGILTKYDAKQIRKMAKFVP
jgi:hypothetical protein